MTVQVSHDQGVGSEEEVAGVTAGEQPLAATELGGVLDALREGIQIIDRDFRYVYLNAAAAGHGRTSRERLLGRTMTECYPGIETTSMFDTLRQAMRGVSGSLKNEFTYADGQRRTFELRVEPCALGIVVLSIDVTENLQLEEQFRQAQKMEAVGRLAGSVAHDFNNLLSVILSASGLLLEDLRPVDPIRADVDAIRRAGERAAVLTHRLLAFSRQQVLAPCVLDLNEVLHDAEGMLRRLLGEDVEFVIHRARDLPKIEADPGQLEQVIMNLVVNARDAMPDGGKLTIETRQVVLDADYARQHVGAKHGAHVMLAVSDTGIGMDRDTQSRIFEPFFTTKPVGKGTGLGLSTVFGIVKQSGGHVLVYSEPGCGTTFKVYLPRVDGPAVEPRVSARPTTLHGSETVLLVEDEDDVRQIAEQALRRYGYHVIAAKNAGEALLFCENDPRTIDLLLTDVVMPQMSGQKLAERLLKVRAGMKVLFMSGYAENAVVQHGILDSGIAYLQKPLLPEHLARGVREVLDPVVPARASQSRGGGP